MPKPEDIVNQMTLLGAYRRRLAAQLRQLAGQGGMHAPPGLLEDIREARREIARIMAVLRGWGVTVEALPDDVDPAEALASAAPRRLRVFISYKHEVTPDEPLAWRWRRRCGIRMMCSSTRTCRWACAGPSRSRSSWRARTR